MDDRHQLEMQLSAYLDDELKPEERRELESLLERDGEARAVLEELRATVEAVRSLPRAKASGRLMESLRSQLERQALLGTPAMAAHPQARGRSPLRWLTAAAVLTLATTAGYLMWPIAQDYWRPTLKVADKSHVDQPARPVPEALEPPARVASRDLADADRDRSESVAAKSLAPDKSATVEELGQTTIAAKPQGSLELKQEAGKTPYFDAMALGGALSGAKADQLGAWNQAAGARPGFTPELARAPLAGGLVSDGAVVLELSYADAGLQRRAIDQLKDAYAFQATESAVDKDATTDLYVAVDSEEAAQELVASIQASPAVGTPASLMVVRAKGDRAGAIGGVDLKRGGPMLIGGGAGQRSFGSPPGAVGRPSMALARSEAEGAAPTRRARESSAGRRQTGYAEGVEQREAAPALAGESSDQSTREPAATAPSPTEPSAMLFTDYLPAKEPADHSMGKTPAPATEPVETPRPDNRPVDAVREEAAPLAAESRALPAAEPVAPNQPVGGPAPRSRAVRGPDDVKMVAAASRPASPTGRGTTGRALGIGGPASKPATATAPAPARVLRLHVYVVPPATQPGFELPRIELQPATSASP